MTEQVIDQAAIEKRGEAAAMQRVNEILATGQAYEKHGGMEVAREAITAGHDLRWVNEQIMKRMAAGQGFSPAAPDVGLSNAEVQRYSLTRLMRAMVAQHEGDRKAWDGAGLEREAHEALVKRGNVPQRGGMFIPSEIQRREMPLMKRDQTVASASGGGYLVGTTNDAASFIDLLRARMLMVQLGVTVLPGLQGNMTIPKQTAGGTAYWLSSESTAISESAMTLGQVALTPKNVGAYTEASRQLLIQSSPAVDMLLWDSLSKDVATAIDAAIIKGSGSSGQPTGIVNTSGIGSVTGTSLAYEDILEFQTDVATGEALVDTCAYVTTPSVASLLAQRQRFSSTDSPLWVGNLLDGSVSGFKARTTNQMDSATMLFGDFSSAVLGEWGVLELALNPYANFAAAVIGFRAIATVDVAIRRASAFSYASSIT